VTARKSVLLVSSSGGVLLELLALAPWWSRHDAVWAAVKAADTETVLAPYRVHWIPELSLGCPLAVRLRCSVRSRCCASSGRGSLFLRIRPAVPFFLAAKLSACRPFGCRRTTFSLIRGFQRESAPASLSGPAPAPGAAAAHPQGAVVGELY
jgi:hypothetical protein